MDTGANLTNVTSSVSTDAPTQLNKITPGVTNIILATFIVLQIVVALGGNIIVVASFCTFRDLRTKCNFFIISLAVSDILVALIAMPFWFTIQLNGDWVYDDRLKQFWDWMDILCGTASIMNLTAVSFDRQLAITSPFAYPKILTTRRVIYIICFVWCYALIISSLKLVSLPERYGWPYPKYLFFVSATSFFLPLFVMLVMYTRIYLVARYQAKRIGRNYASDVKAAKTIAVVIGGFVICWLPFFMVVISWASPHIKPLPDTFLNIAKWLEYLNSCLNPVIYTCLNRTYRNAFKKLFHRCRSKIMRDNRDPSTGTSWLTMAETHAITHAGRECSSDAYRLTTPNGGVMEDINENLPFKEDL